MIAALLAILCATTIVSGWDILSWPEFVAIVASYTFLAALLAPIAA